MTESRDAQRSLLHYGPRPEPVFLMPNLSGDHMLSFDSGGDGAFSLAVPAAEAGLYDIRVNFVQAEDYGIVELEINGRKAGGPVDTFLKTSGLTRPIWPPKEAVFSDVPLNAGTNTFQFTVNSKNADSSGFRLGLDSVVLKKSSERE